MVIKPKERKETIEFVCYTFLFIFVALSVHKTQLSRVASNYEIYHCVWPKEHLPNKHWHLFFGSFDVCWIPFKFRSMIRQQGCLSRESACFPPMCSGYDSRTRRHMWVEFFVASLLFFERFFLWVLRFSRLLKTRHFQFDPGIHGHG